MTNTDLQHIAAIRTGDKEGLRLLYREFLPPVSALVTRNGGTFEDAKDVFQDAMLVLFEKCRNDRFELTSAFYTLFYGICRNLWGNRLQKKSRTEVTLSEDFKFNDGTDLEQTMLEEEKNRLFWDAFRRLGLDCQKLLRLFFDKKTMEEIASSMQFSSVGYAKKRKFQCKENLLDLVKADPRYLEYARSESNRTIADE